METNNIYQPLKASRREKIHNVSKRKTEGPYSLARFCDLNGTRRSISKSREKEKEEEEKQVGKITREQYEDLSSIVLNGTRIVDEQLFPVGGWQYWTTSGMRMMTDDYILKEVLKYLKIQVRKEKPYVEET